MNIIFQILITFSLLTLASHAGGVAFLLPLPQVWQAHERAWQMPRDCAVIADKTLRDQLETWRDETKARCGVELQLSDFADKPAQMGGIRCQIDPKLAGTAEGYQIKVSEKGVTLVGKDEAGLFYATRTLKQMLPRADVGQKVLLPHCEITDAPAYPWRGLMLDVARHYQKPADIKRLLDRMADYKLNVFHWHLTDDQGWRLEIKGYPKLTEVGAWRDSTPPYGSRLGRDDKRHGGFYTQEEVKDIVRYAAARHIRIVPEVDIPGHVAAAVAAYPELGNTDIPHYVKPFVPCHWGGNVATLAPNEKTFVFLDTVFTQVCDLFPSTIIHVGGDEVMSREWKASPAAQAFMKKHDLADAKALQAYFIRYVREVVKRKKRTIIGWEEIGEDLTLDKDAAVMGWLHPQKSLAALRRGHPYVVAQKEFTFFDYYQDRPELELAKGSEYEAIGGYLPLEKVYGLDLGYYEMAAGKKGLVLGVQGQLWGEYLHDWWKVEYMAYPRMMALAEVAWRGGVNRDFSGFQKRLKALESSK
jgi:hexosaminidase